VCRKAWMVGDYINPSNQKDSRLLCFFHTAARHPCLGLGSQLSSFDVVPCGRVDLRGIYRVDGEDCI